VINPLRDFGKWVSRNENDESESFQRGVSWGIFWMVVTGCALAAIKHLAGF
jgi:hypothetical protein